MYSVSHLGLLMYVLQAVAQRSHTGLENTGEDGTENYGQKQGNTVHFFPLLFRIRH